MSFLKILIKKLISISILVYLSLLAIGFFYSDQLIFLPQDSTYGWTDDLVRIKSKNASEPNIENSIVARYLKNPNATYTILYSHGNAVDIGGLLQVQQKFYDHGYSIIVYDYSGYGLSDGEPSEQQVYNDVEAVYDYLTRQQQLSPKQIISYGHSLGGGIATDLAFKQPVAALILESPFTSAFRVKTIYSIAPFDKFSSIDKIDSIDAPVFISHSRDDRVIPFWHGEALFEKANQPKQSLWLKNAGHTKITHAEIFWVNLEFFVSKL